MFKNLFISVSPKTFFFIRFSIYQLSLSITFSRGERNGSGQIIQRLKMLFYLLDHVPI